MQKIKDVSMKDAITCLENEGRAWCPTRLSGLKETFMKDGFLFWLCSRNPVFISKEQYEDIWAILPPEPDWGEGYQEATSDEYTDLCAYDLKGGSWTRWMSSLGFADNSIKDGQIVYRKISWLFCEEDEAEEYRVRFTNRSNCLKGSWSDWKKICNYETCTNHQYQFRRRNIKMKPPLGNKYEDWKADNSFERKISFTLPPPMYDSLSWEECVCDKRFMGFVMPNGDLSALPWGYYDGETQCGEGCPKGCDWPLVRAVAVRMKNE